MTTHKVGTVPSERARLARVAGDVAYRIAQVKGDGREEALKHAVRDYELALAYYDKKGLKLRAAEVQNDLGNALRELADVRDKEQNLTKAIDAYHQAHKLYTLVAFPIFHGQTSYNLAVSYLAKASPEAGTDRAVSLKEAAEAARRSLQAAGQEGLQEDAAKAQQLLEQIEELARST